MALLFGDICRNGDGSEDVFATSATGDRVHMKIRFLGGRYQGRITDLSPDGFSIGRGTDNDLVLDEEGTSRHHGRIYAVGPTWYVEDLDSTNGVRVNGEHIEGSRELKPGDRIGISQHVLLFTDGSDMVESELVVPTAAKRQGQGAVAAAPPDEATMPARDVAMPARFPWVRAILLVCVLGLLVGGAYRVANRASSDRSSSTAGETPADVTGEDDLTNLMARDRVGVAGSGVKEKVLAAPTEPLPPVSLALIPEQGDGATAGTGDVAVPGGGSAGGAAVVTSDPSGASVWVDGDTRGTTPLALALLPAGRHTLTLRLAGYQEFVRQIHVPNLLPDPANPYVLQQAPGTLRVTSEPPGAAVLSGTQILGRTPLVLSDLGPGEHELRVMSIGYEPKSEVVTLAEDRPVGVHVELVSVLGGLEIVTAPPGCRVFVDSHYKGTTVAEGADMRESAPLRIGGLREGEHAVRLEHRIGGERTGKARVSRDAWNRLSLRLWVVDTKLTLSDGSVKIGMVVEETEEGDVVLAESPKEVERYAKGRVASSEVLSPSAVAEYMSTASGGGKPKRSGGEALQGGGGGLFGTGDEDDEGTDAAGAGAPAGEDETEGPREYTPDALLRLLKMTSATELARQFTDVAVRIRGVPTGVSRDGPRWRVDFGPKIRCYFSRFDYDNAKAQLGVSRARDEDIIVAGTAEGYYITGLVIRDCELQRGVEEGNGEE